MVIRKHLLAAMAKLHNDAHQFVDLTTLPSTTPVQVLVVAAQVWVSRHES